MAFAGEKYDISVVIPTFNGEARVPDVLNALKSQRGISGIRFEVLVVDNNSTDRTKEIVLYHIGKYGALLNMHYLFEARPGAGWARKLGAERARGEFLGFLDDDNVPDEMWIRNAVEFGRRHPRAAAWASRVWPAGDDFPVWFWDIAPYLGNNYRGEDPLLYKKNVLLLPPSAGLVVRKSCWEMAVSEHTAALTGFSGSSDITGEDMEALGRIRNLPGTEIWYAPSLRVEHRISPGRLDPGNLYRLFRGIGLSRFITRKVFFDAGLYYIFVSFCLMVRDLLKSLFFFAGALFAGRKRTPFMCRGVMFLFAFLGYFYWMGKSVAAFISGRRGHLFTRL